MFESQSCVVEWKAKASKQAAHPTIKKTAIFMIYTDYNVTKKVDLTTMENELIEWMNEWMNDNDHDGNSNWFSIS